MKSKIITGFTKEVENELNKWLEENSHKLVDVKFAGRSTHLSVLILYHEVDHI